MIIGVDLLSYLIPRKLNKGNFMREAFIETYQNSDVICWLLWLFDNNNFVLRCKCKTYDLADFLKKAWVENQISF